MEKIIDDLMPIISKSTNKSELASYRKGTRRRILQLQGSRWPQEVTINSLKRRVQAIDNRLDAIKASRGVYRVGNTSSLQRPGNLEAVIQQLNSKHPGKPANDYSDSELRLIQRATDPTWFNHYVAHKMKPERLGDYIESTLQREPAQHAELTQNLKRVDRRRLAKALGAGWVKEFTGKHGGYYASSMAKLKPPSKAKGRARQATSLTQESLNRGKR